MRTVLLYDDEEFERHETGVHPESAERLRSIRKELARTGLTTRCRRGETRSATVADLERVHGAAYIAEVREASARGGGRLDPDTVAAPASYEVALRAVGTALDAVDQVLTKDVDAALCLIRPPGHHALPQRAMGFCLFANIALAAAYARAKHELDRVLIVDWDVHHGNGTQDIFYRDGQVHFLSLHRSPFYPGTGAADETGTGPGLGATLNVPLRFGTPRKDYIDHFTRALETAATRCKPQLILVSAGFDAHAEDPIGSLGLESEDFGTLTRLVRDVAAIHCRGRIVSLLEGGYNVDKLAESVAVHLTELLREPA